MSLLRPQFLLLLIVYIPLIFWYIKKYNGANPYMGISTTEAFASVGISWKEVLMHLSFVIRLLAIGALIVALCRPQTHDSVSTSQVEGTDIIIAMDISGSMTTSD